MIQTNKIKEVLLKVTDPKLKIVSADQALLFQAGHGIESLNPSLKFFALDKELLEEMHITTLPFNPAYFSV